MSLSLVWASSALALDYRDIVVSDVTTESFVVTWPAEPGASASVNVFADLQRESVSNVLVESNFNASANAALAAQTQTLGLMRVRVSGLTANTPYFYDIQTTPEATGITSTFPESGESLLSVVTQKNGAPYSSDSVAVEVLAQDETQAVLGSVVFLYVDNAAYPLSAVVGDGYEDSIAVINLTNLYDVNSEQHLSVAGGEDLTAVAIGNDGTQAEVASELLTNTLQGQITWAISSAVSLGDSKDTDEDGIPDAYEDKTPNLSSTNFNDAAEDADEDGLTNLEEFLLGTDPNNPDTDNDGLSDGEEALYGTSPAIADTDRDGRTDGSEINDEIKSDPLNRDSDGDGVSDGIEVDQGFDPTDATDFPKEDTDGDGVADIDDNCVYGANPDQADFDGDSEGNVCDLDDDNDGINDVDDNAPFSNNPDQLDTDGDNVGNVIDNCAEVINYDQSDYDADGLGDACDDDDDNDTVLDWKPLVDPSDAPLMVRQIDSVPFNTLLYNASADAVVIFSKFHVETNRYIAIGDFYFSTQTYIPRALSSDDEALDGLLFVIVDARDCLCISLREKDSITVEIDGSLYDIHFSQKFAQTDWDYSLFVSDDGSTYRYWTDAGSALAELLQSSIEREALDNCRLLANLDQLDSDGDGVGDACTFDSTIDFDLDGVLNENDNCPYQKNADQLNNDNDLLGDVCDADDDNDGIVDDDDSNPFVPGGNQTDNDGDGVFDFKDNCLNTFNPDQSDTDADGIGDECDGDADTDGDGIPDFENGLPLDNCPSVANPGQEDSDNDGTGDACDLDTDNDGLDYQVELELRTQPNSADSDGDGILDGDEDFDFDGLTNAEEIAQGSDPLLRTIVLLPGDNHIHLRLGYDSDFYASDFLEQINGEVNVTSVKYYSTGFESFIGLEYIDGVWSGTDFKITSDQGIIVTATKRFIYEDDEYITCVDKFLSRGFSFSGLNCVPNNLYSYDIQDIFVYGRTITSIERFNAKTQAFEKTQFIDGVASGDNFLLTNTHAYSIDTPDNPLYRMPQTFVAFEDFTHGQVVLQNTIDLKGVLSQPFGQVWVNGEEVEVTHEEGTSFFELSNVLLTDGINDFEIEVRGGNSIVSRDALSLEYVGFPRITYETPGENQTAYGSAFNIRGRIEGDLTSLTIDGKQATIDEQAYADFSYYNDDDSFSVYVDLQKGENELLVVAEDTNGTVQESYYKINYTPVRVVLTQGEELRNTLNFYLDRRFSNPYYQTFKFTPNAKLLPEGLSLEDNGTDYSSPWRPIIAASEDLEPGFYSFDASYNFTDSSPPLAQKIDLVYEVYVTPINGAPLAMLEPENASGTAFDTSSITITGILSDANGSLHINGERVNVVDGNFVYDLTLQPGWNEYTFATQNENGSYEQTIRYLFGSPCVVDESYYKDAEYYQNSDDPLVDSDGDGFNNAQEILAGTSRSDACDAPESFQVLSTELFNPSYGLFEEHLDSQTPYIIASSGDSYTVTEYGITSVLRDGERIDLTGAPMATSFSLALSESFNVFYAGYSQGVFSVSTESLEVEDFFETGIESSVLSSPAVDHANNIYFADSGGNVYSFNGTTAQERWRIETGSKISTSPVVDFEGNTIVGNHSGVVTKVSGGGEILWQKSVEGALLAPTALAGNGDIIVATDAGFVYRLSADGDFLWSTRLVDEDLGFHYPVTTSPVISDSGIIIVAGHSSIVADNSPPEEEYGILTAYNPAGELLWRKSFRPNKLLVYNSFYGTVTDTWYNPYSPIVVDDYVIFQDSDYIGGRSYVDVKSITDGITRFDWTTPNFDVYDISLIYRPVLADDGTINLVSARNLVDYDATNPFSTGDGDFLYKLAFPLSEVPRKAPSWIQSGNTAARLNHSCTYGSEVLSIAADQDNDGLPDCFEYVNELDPFEADNHLQDLDEDGLSNMEEFLSGTDIRLHDSDFDLVPDYEEVNTFSTDARARRDSDGDFLSDDLENSLGLDVNVSNKWADSDSDGYSDTQEALANTDPLDASSLPVPGSVIFDGTTTKVLSSVQYRTVIDTYGQYFVSFSGNNSKTEVEDRAFVRFNPSYGPDYRSNIYDVPTLVSDDKLLVGRDVIDVASWQNIDEIDTEENSKFSSAASVSASRIHVMEYDNRYQDNRDQNGSSTLYAYDTIGNPEWNYVLVDDTFSSSVIDASGALYFVDGKTLVKLDKAGEKLWAYDVNSANNNLAIDRFSGNIYLTRRSGELLAFSKDGRFLWQHNLASTITSNVVVDDNDNVIVGDTAGNIVSLTSVGSVNWMHAVQDADIVSLAVSAKGYLYAASSEGAISAYRIDENGLVARWQQVVPDRVVSPLSIDYDGNVSVVTSASSSSHLTIFIDDSGGPGRGWSMARHDPSGSGSQCHYRGVAIAEDIDTDNDGFSDCLEILWSDDVLNGIDPSQDSDLDGISNAIEQERGTNIFVSDSDGDGLTDGQEINEFLTNPLSKDSDGDGITDDVEIDLALDPLSNSSDAYEDIDEDGFSNRVEAIAQTLLDDESSTPSIGEPLWEVLLDTAFTRSVIRKDGTQVLHSSSSLVGINPSGRVLARKEFIDEQIIQSILTHDNHTYVATDLTLSLLDESLDVLWNVDEKGIVAQLSLVNDSQVVFVRRSNILDNRYEIVSYSSAGMVLWREPIVIESAIETPPLVATDGSIRIFATSGDIISLDREGSIIGNDTLPELANARSISLSRNDVYFAHFDQAKIKAVSAEGQLLWDRNYKETSSGSDAKREVSRVLVQNNGNVVTLVSAIELDDQIKQKVEILSGLNGDTIQSIELENVHPVLNEKLALGQNNSLYLADDFLYHFSADGSLISTIDIDSLPSVSLYADYDGVVSIILEMGQQLSLRTFAGVLGGGESVWQGQSNDVQSTHNLCSSKFYLWGVFEDSDGDSFNDCVEFVIGTDPLMATADDVDSDGDGLSDNDEMVAGTNINERDTDDDGLTDYEEVVEHQTNPLVKDTDHDGLLDNYEVAYGMNASEYSAAADTDGDGYSDRAEFLGGTDPSSSTSQPDIGYRMEHSEDYLASTFQSKAVLTDSGDLVFPNANNELVAISASGEKRWRVSYGDEVPIGLSVFDSNNAVFVTETSIRFVDNDGVELWNRSLTQAHNLSVSEDAIYVATDDELLALDRNNQVLWRTSNIHHRASSLDSEISEMLVSAFGDIVLCTNHTIRSFDDSGMFLWSYPAQGSCGLDFAFTSQGFLIVPTELGEVFALGKTGNVVWRVDSGSAYDVVNSVLVDASDNVFVHGGPLGGSHQLIKIDVDGEMTTVLSLSTTIPGFITRDNTLAISLDGSNTVQVYNLDSLTLEYEVQSNVYDVAENFFFDEKTYLVLGDDGIAYYWGYGALSKIFVSKSGLATEGWPVENGEHKGAANQCDVVNQGRQDNDGDGVSDCVETVFGFDASNTLDMNQDLDSDGLANGEELILGTNTRDEDSDRDDLTDYEEEKVYFSNPLDNDSDGDGLPDGYEQLNGFDVNGSLEGLQDNDNNGFSDRIDVLIAESEQTPVPGDVLRVRSGLGKGALPGDIVTATSDIGTKYVLTDYEALVALDMNGDYVWQYDFDEATSLSNIVVLSSGNIIVSWTGNVSGPSGFYNVTNINVDGTLAWTKNYELNKDGVAIDHDDNIYFLDGENAIGISSSGNEFLNVDLGSSLNGSITDGYVFVDKNETLFVSSYYNLLSIDLDTRTISKASTDLKFGARIVTDRNNNFYTLASRADTAGSQTSVVVFDQDLLIEEVATDSFYSDESDFISASDGTVFFTDGDTRLYAVRDGAVLWYRDFSERLMPTSLVAFGDTSVVISTESYIYGLSHANTVVWSYTYPVGITEDASFFLDTDGLLTVSTNESRVYSIYATDSDSSIGPWFVAGVDNRRTNNAYPFVLDAQELPSISIINVPQTLIQTSQTVELEAIAADEKDGNLSDLVTWEINGELVGSGATFTYTSESVGEVSITAKVVDSDGFSSQYTATLVVERLTTPPIVNILSDSLIEMIDVDPVYLWVTVEDDDPSYELTITWRSSIDGLIGSGVSADLAGLSIGLHEIVVEVIDTDGLVTVDTTEVLVIENQPPVIEILGFDETKTYLLGDRVFFNVNVTDPEGEDLKDEVSWGRYDIGEKNGLSLLEMGFEEGGNIVTATVRDSHEAEATDTIHVRTRLGDPEPRLTITSPSGNVSVLVGEELSFEAIATDDQDGNISGQIFWSIHGADTILLGTGSDEDYSFNEVGDFVVTARIEDSDGNVAEDSFEVSVVISPDAPIITILAPVSDSVEFENNYVSFDATAVDNQSRDISDQIIWTSSLDGNLGDGASLSLSSLSVGDHQITVSVTDSGGLTATETRQLTIEQIVGGELTLVSIAEEDGWVRQSAEGSSVGGKVDPDNRFSGALRTGDDEKNRQLKGIVSFDIGAIPADATIRSASLYLARNTGSYLAGDPDDAFGDMYLDVNAGSFSGDAALEVSDYQAEATASQVMRIDDEQYVNLTFNAEALSVLNAAVLAGESRVQMRLTYPIDSNGDEIEDYLGYYSSDATDSDDHPALYIEYTNGPLEETNTPPTISIDTPFDGSEFSEGDVIELTASASDAEDGEFDNAITWASSVDGDLGNGATVSLSSLSLGEHVIEASVTDSSGVTALDSVTIMIEETVSLNAPELTILSPSTDSEFMVGSAVLFRAEAIDDEDGNISSTIVWTSSLDNVLGEGSSLSSHILSEGEHTITASVTDTDSQEVSTTFDITITLSDTPSAFTRIEAEDYTDYFDTDSANKGGSYRDDAVDIQPTSAAEDDGYNIGWIATDEWLTYDLNLNAGTYDVSTRVALNSGEGQYSLSLGDASINAVVITPTGGTQSWVTQNIGELVVAESGVITLRFDIENGSFNLNWIELSRQDDIENTPPSISINAPLNSSEFTEGDAVDLSASASDPEDGVFDNGIVWASNIDGELGSGENFSVSTLSVGEHELDARVVDSDGIEAVATVTIFILSPVNSEPTIIITSPESESDFTQGEFITLTASADDFEDGNISTDITWSSNIDGDLENGETISTDQLSIGTHIITASVVDSGGQLSFSTVSIHVLEPVNTEPTLTVFSPAEGASFTSGEIVTFNAMATDLEDSDLSSAIEWHSNVDGVLFNGSLTTRSDLSPGEHVITVSVVDSDGLQASTEININVIAENIAPTITILSSTSNSEFFVGDLVNLSAQASDEEDGDLSALIVWSSNIDNNLGEGATLSITSLSEGDHIITASVTDSDFSQVSTTIDIRVNEIIDEPVLLRVEAEDYDNYYDFDSANRGGDYRDDGVDIQETKNEDPEGFNVGWTEIGEWLSYDLNLVAGTYDITVRAASPSGGGSYIISLGDESTEAVAIDPTGNWQFWETHSAGELVVPSSGAITLRFDIVSKGFNLNWIELTRRDQGNEAPTIVINSPVEEDTLTEGNVVELSANASDAEDGIFDSGIIWTSSIDGEIGSGERLSVSTLSIGEHELEARVVDSGGLEAAATITIFIVSPVNSDPTIVITSPESGSNFTQGELIALTASADDDEDGALSAEITWSSDIDGDLDVGGERSIDRLSIGDHIITATIVDSAGQSSFATVSIRVLEPVNTEPEVTIFSPVDGASFTVGEIVTFNATATDVEDGDLSSKIQWHSNLDNVLFDGSVTTISDLSVGEHEITVSVTDTGGLQTSRTIDIVVVAENLAPEITVLSPNNNDEFFDDTEVNFRASAIDSEEGDLSSAIEWSSNVDGSLGVGNSIDVTLSIGEHIVTATVADSEGLPSVPVSIALTVIDSQLDSDRDGMSDIWEDLNGLNSQNYDDRYADSDEDGYNAYLEFISDTDPNSQSSVPLRQHYVLNTNQLGNDIQVASLVDGNTIVVGDQTLELDKNDLATILGEHVTSGVLIEGQGAFALGSLVNATDLPASSFFAGKRFAVPQQRNAHLYFVLSTEGDANVSLSINGESMNYTAIEGEVLTIQVPAINSTSVVIESDKNILVEHAGATADTPTVDGYPVPPVSYELIGSRRSAYISAVEDNTSVDVYTSSGASETLVLNAGERASVSVGNNGSHGNSDIARLVSDKPIAAVQYADGDGSETTAFFDPVFLANHYVIPVDAQYLQVGCLTTSIVSLVDELGESITTECIANGEFPGSVFFGSTTSGIHINAGAVLSSDGEIYVMYEASNSDEHNLLGVHRSETFWSANIDSDGDSMMDLWEAIHGLKPLDATDRAQDLDGDGINNFVEYMGESDPGNAMSTPLTRYHILNPKFVGNDISVVSLENDNEISIGTSSYTVQKNELLTISGSNIILGAVLEGTGAFSVSSATDSTDMPAFGAFAGTEFVIPHIRNSHFYYLLSKSVDTRVEINRNGIVDTVDLPAGEVVTFNAGNTNSMAALLKSDSPILVTHAGTSGTSPNRDVYSVPPVELELWGSRRQGTVAALEDGTTVSVFTSDGQSETITLNAGESKKIGVGDDSSNGASSMARLVADKPIAAVQYGDADGNETTAYYSNVFFGRHYGIPTDAQYVQATCAVESNITLHNGASAPTTQVCLPEGDFPGRVVFGSTVNGAHISAGSYLESNDPFFMIYENSSSSDEHNLIGR